MNNRRLAILSLIGIILVTAGFLFWLSELDTEKRTQEYIQTLEELGCIVEEYPFSDSHVEGVIKMYFFSDFRSFAMQEEIDQIYCDRETHSLYFFHPIQDVKVEIIVFDYR